MHPLLPHFRLHPLAHAAICLGLAMPLQAAWAQQRHAEGDALYGLPPGLDPLEGWIVTADKP